MRHTCTTKPAEVLQFISAGGHALSHHGDKAVQCQKDGAVFETAWHVSDVRRPTLSIAESVKQGNSYLFTPSGSVLVPRDIFSHHEGAHELTQRDNLFFLPARRVRGSGQPRAGPRDCAG